MYFILPNDDFTGFVHELLEQPSYNENKTFEYSFRCSRCRWLYSLTSECVIISLIMVHVLATTIEILVHLDLIHGKLLDLRVCDHQPYYSTCTGHYDRDLSTSRPHPR